MPEHTRRERIKHMMKKMPPKEATKRAMHEVMANEPSTVSRAKVSESRKRKMKIAIALSKARKASR